MIFPLYSAKKINYEYIKDEFKCGVTAGKIIFLVGDSHGTVLSKDVAENILCRKRKT